MPRKTWLDSLSAVGKNCLAGEIDDYIVVAFPVDAEPYGFNPDASGGPTARIATTSGFQRVSGVRVSLNAVRDADPEELTTQRKNNAGAIKRRARRA